MRLIYSLSALKHFADNAHILAYSMHVATRVVVVMQTDARGVSVLDENAYINILYMMHIINTENLQVVGYTFFIERNG